MENIVKMLHVSKKHQPVVILEISNHPGGSDPVAMDLNPGRL